MRCQVPGRALRSAKFCRVSSSPRPISSGCDSASGCRTPKEKLDVAVLAVLDVALVERDLARPEEVVRRRERGDRAARRSRRRRAGSARGAARCRCSRRRRTGSPARCSTRRARRRAMRPSIRSPLSPASYLYATESTSVFAIDLLLDQVRAFVDRVLQAAVNTPSCTPSKLTSRRAPLVLTSHPRAAYVAVARLISSGFRGRPG